MSERSHFFSDFVAAQPGPAEWRARLIHGAGKVSVVIAGWAVINFAGLLILMVLTGLVEF